METNEQTTTTRKPTKKELRIAAELATLASQGAFEQNVADAEDDAEAEGEEAKPRSVVRGTYKAKYAERGEEVRKAKGFTKKAAKRSCSDWLAQQLGIRTLDEKAQLVVGKFEAILDANGVKHDHWNRTTKGWQGRLRMTGRLALQRVVAENGELRIDDTEVVKAPASWVSQHQR